MDWLTSEIVAIAILAISGMVWLRSSLVKQHHKEVKELAATRGERVEDLEQKQEALEKEVNDLRAEVRFLRATFTEEFINDVVDGVKEALK